ncbi:ethanolamine ammonia-lyase subunit EutC [Corallincola platygyrae]|uniref:Ethanolamine ammonia-lyase small subunit n=1 Tax=Corallincola platygyrae TaxID=1193278 RepID=A0ABW4XJP2_9GAMM
MNKQIVSNPWRVLNQFTDARIGLGRAGGSLPTEELLKFQLAHARARDAVHQPLDIADLVSQLGSISDQLPHLKEALTSQANDRISYLQRPDLGRKLNEASINYLKQQVDVITERAAIAQSFDLAIVIVDGLSSTAVQTNASPLIAQLFSALNEERLEWSIAPLVLVTQGRVAIGDEIGALMHARAVLVLIGERPGLSSPDSLGIYLTHDPQPGRTDAQRNCISNVRPGGLSYSEACNRTLYLLREARRLGLSGVQLKDRSDENVIEHQSSNFLLDDSSG